MNPIVLIIALLIAACPRPAGAQDTLEIRSDLQGTVFRVHPDEAATESGTAFTVKAPSGKNYTLTNGHICQPSTDGYIYMEVGDKTVKRKILARYDNHDLCLVEAVSGSKPIELADKVGIEHATIIGYPLAQPLSVVNGDIVGYRNIDVDMEDPPEYCRGKPNHAVVREDNEFFQFHFPHEVCRFSGPVLATTIVTGPGGSGSPVINLSGKLIGVLFAYDVQVPFGSLVPLEFVRDFLKDK